ELRRDVAARDQGNDGLQGTAPRPVARRGGAVRDALPAADADVAGGAGGPGQGGQRPEPVGAGPQVHEPAGHQLAGRPGPAHGRRVARVEELRHDVAERGPREAGAVRADPAGRLSERNSPRISYADDVRGSARQSKRRMDLYLPRTAA